MTKLRNDFSILPSPDFQRSSVLTCCAGAPNYSRGESVSSTHASSLGRHAAAHPGVSMSLKVKDGEAAYVSKPIDVHRKLAEEVDDGSCAGGERVPQNEGGDDDREKLVEKEDDLHGEEEGESGVHLWRRRTKSAVSAAPIELDRATRTYLGGMQLAVPLLGKVVRVLDDSAHRLLRVDDPVLVGHHSPRHRQHRPEHSDVEEDGPSWGDLKV